MTVDTTPLVEFLEKNLGPKLKEAIAKAFEEGRRAGIEDAAKVAEIHAPRPEPGVNDTRQIHSAGMTYQISAAIRALLDKKAGEP